MSKKHFKALAEVLAHHNAEYALCADIADICERASPLVFDRAWFMTACNADEWRT